MGKPERWSWHQLLRECEGDEERALERLMDKQGYGEAEPHPGADLGDWQPSTTLEHHEVAMPITGPMDIDLDNLGQDRTHFRYHHTVGAHGQHLRGLRDVSSRNLGCPFSGSDQMPDGRSREEMLEHGRKGLDVRWGR